jgi:GAF domain-containing protein
MPKKTPKHRASRDKRSGKGSAPVAVERLAAALGVAGAAAELGRGDHARLLQAIVGTAVRVIDATAGSLLLLDRAGDALQFEVAVGPGADEVKALRVPIGQGIAGFVASTGQTLAIADTSEDPRFARAIAEGSGYVPHNLLCVPLLLDERVIGVMELLDKQGGATPFMPDDISALAAFSEQAALAIHLSLQAQSLNRLLDGMLRGTAAANDTSAIAAWAEDAPAHARTLALARQVAAVAGAGERQTRLCAEILAAVSTFVAGPDGGDGYLAGLAAGF